MVGEDEINDNAVLFAVAYDRILACGAFSLLLHDSFAVFFQEPGFQRLALIREVNCQSISILLSAARNRVVFFGTIKSLRLSARAVRALFYFVAALDGFAFVVKSFSDSDAST